MPSHDELTADNLHFLAQGMELLTRLDDATFATQLPAVGSSIGGHFRHCLDLYSCFLAGLDSGAVDYDARGRDPRIEVEREYALSVGARLTERLRALPADDGARPLRVSGDRPRREATEEDWCLSSVARELQFLRSHTVHHYALIAVLLRLHGVEVDPEFGVAPATLAYRRQHELAG
jgi:uncharacterized damage-inducible protein DinB